MRTNLTNQKEQKLNSPKIIFLGSDFSSEQIQSTYSALGVIQNLAPYNATVSMVVEKIKESFCATIEMASIRFSTKLAIEDSNFNDLIISLKEKTKEQLLEWKSTRF